MRGEALLRRIAALWRGVRTVSGDDAYERYRAHHAACGEHGAPLGRRAFYDAEQRRKWSGVSRCC